MTSSYCQPTANASFGKEGDAAYSTSITGGIGSNPAFGGRKLFERVEGGGGVYWLMIELSYGAGRANGRD